jgi:hypothetical protein
LENERKFNDFTEIVLFPDEKTGEGGEEDMYFLLTDESLEKLKVPAEVEDAASVEVPAEVDVAASVELAASVEDAANVTSSVSSGKNSLLLRPSPHVRRSGPKPPT